MILLQDFESPAAKPPVSVFYATVPHPTMTNIINEEDAPPAYDDGLNYTATPDTNEKSRPAGSDLARNRSIGTEHDTSPGVLGDYPFAFKRPLPSYVTSRISENSAMNSFQPLVHHSKTKRLEDGFYLIPPPTDAQLHPFTLRDVGEQDWVKFLNDIQISARITGERTSTGSSTDSIQRGNFFQSLGAVIRSVSGNDTGRQTELDARGPGSLVDLWNKNFFHPRGLDVVLAKGSRRLNGDRSQAPPDFSPGATSSRGPPPVVHPMPNCQIPRALPASHIHEPVPNVTGPRNYVDAEHNRTSGDPRSRSTLSVSTISSESSISSSERAPRALPPSHGVHNYDNNNSRFDRRAEKHARRIERHIQRKERRVAKKCARFERKLSRWEARTEIRSSGAGSIPRHFEREGRHEGPSSRVDGLQSAVEMLKSTVLGTNEDGYYRLIITNYSS